MERFQEVMPTLPPYQGGESGKDNNIHPVSGVFMRTSEQKPSSQFQGLRDAKSYIMTKLDSSYPIIDRGFVDAVANWLQPEKSGAAKAIMQSIRDEWIVPYVTTNDGRLFETVLHLSHLLDDEEFARSTWRSMVLEEPARAQLLKSKIKGLQLDAMGNIVDPEANMLYVEVKKGYLKGNESNVKLTDADVFFGASDSEKRAA